LANTKDRYRHARAEGYRSGLEVAVARQMEALKEEFDYEVLRIPFLVEETRHYVPDFVLRNGIILECKGRWQTPDRKKHRLIHAQYPDLDIRFVFSRPRERISKQSRTTYEKFCQTQGWTCAGPQVPVEWLREPINVRSLRAINKLLAGGK
jgi:hypothetical protein